MPNLSLNQQKYFCSLQQKKYRNLHRRFLIEGEKMVLEFLENKNSLYKAVRLLCSSDYREGGFKLPGGLECIETDERDMKKISSLSTPNKLILEIEMPENPEKLPLSEREVMFFLEDIRDPGNMGTIMRTADWFGAGKLFCSRESVDIYNPKVLQSSMGSFSRIRVYYTDVVEIFRFAEDNPDFQLMATSMKGENLFKMELPSAGMIFFGNESRGLSEFILSRCKRTISIPSLSNRTIGPESLNLSVSAGIVMSEFARRGSIRNGN